MADVSPSPLTTVAPTRGVTVNPLLSLSKLKYLVWVELSIAMAAPSVLGLLAEVGVTGSPGWVTSVSGSAKLALTSWLPEKVKVIDLAVPLTAPPQLVNW